MLSPIGRYFAGTKLDAVYTDIKGLAIIISGPG
jgi:hypothetical protein